jgi:hypothetical protein
MCVSHLRESQLYCHSDSCALADHAAAGQYDWQTIARAVIPAVHPCDDQGSG